MTDQDLPSTPQTTAGIHNATTAAGTTATTSRSRLAGSRSRNALLGVSALGLLAVGAAGGAAAWSAVRGQEASFDTALAPTAIAALTDTSAVGVEGKVAEIYGNKFVITDGAARALVETGPAGEGAKLVEVGENITVQGRFDDGSLHAYAIRHADQRIDELTPPPPAGGPGHGPGHKHGPRDPAPLEGGPIEDN